jgi:hypothetical protein
VETGVFRVADDAVAVSGGRDGKGGAGALNSQLEWPLLVVSSIRRGRPSS